MRGKQSFYAFRYKSNLQTGVASSAEVEWIDENGNTYTGTLYLVPKEGEEKQTEERISLPSHELESALSGLRTGFIKFFSLLLSPPWPYIILLLISVIVAVALVQFFAR